MSRRLVIALGAALLLAVGGIAAEARPFGGGGGGGGGGGMHPGGGMGSHAFQGNSFHGNSFHGNSFRGNSFRSGPRMGRMDRGYSHRGSVLSRNFDRHGHHHHHRGRFIAGVPYFYDYGYGNYGDCGYYYRRALATGSPYWWNRYEDCEYAG